MEISSLRTETISRFEGFDYRFEGIDHRFDAVEIKLDSLEKRIPGIEEITALKLKIAEIEKRLAVA